MKTTLELIEYDKFKNIFKRFTTTEYGKKLVDSLVPDFSVDKAKNSLEIFEQFRDFFENGNLPPVDDIYIEEILEKSKKETLGPDYIKEIGAFLNMLSNVESDFSQPEFQYLYHSYINFHKIEQLKEKIRISIDEYGYVKDTASKRLRELREEIKNLREDITRSMKKLFHTGARTVIIDTNVFFRKSRYTLLVKPNFREYLNGRIVDVSKTGGYFVEPFSISAKNDRLEETIFLEEAETRRILSEITELIRTNYDKLKENGKKLAFLDMQMAKYFYSKRFGTCQVEFTNTPSLYAEGAKHPVLVDIKKDDVVGVTIDLEKDKHIVVTGPNTGGKTVFIKTTGLLVATVYSGIPPIASVFRVGPISSIEAAIGDEQNIEDSLSGFSAKMERINKILNSVTASTLVLIDEIGSGTSPDEGEAIAYAVAHFLKRKGCMFVISTHYRQLAHILKSEGFRLASFEFDEKTLTPTYKISYNRIGKSYGINVLDRLGTNEAVIRIASNFFRNRKNSINSLIDNIETELSNLDRKTQEMEAKRREYEHLLAQEKRNAEVLKKKLEDERTKSRKELERLLQEARSLLRRIMKDKNISKAHREINRIKTQITALKPHESEQEPLQDLKQGDIVEFRGKTCKIIKIKNTQAKIEFDSGLMDVPISMLKKTGETDKNVNITLQSKQDDQFEINLIGKRREEALMELINFLDYASTEGVKSVRIIHGRGSGVLKDMVRDELKKYPNVRKFYMAPPNQGGDGATIAELG